MNARQQKVVVGVLALVALGGGIAAFVAYGGPDAAGDLVADDDAEPTATPDMAETDAAYDYRIEAVEECGETCRDVTATLINDGEEDADDVVVETTLFADGDVVWEGDERIGSLDAGEDFTSTQRIDVGVDGGARIQANDGVVTIETVVRFEDGVEVFVEEREVA